VLSLNHPNPCCLSIVGFLAPSKFFFLNSLKSFPATGNAFVIGCIFANEAAADVVLGFIGPVRRHAPEDGANAIAGVAVGALSFHS
jgi:hypothetical protein